MQLKHSLTRIGSAALFLATAPAVALAVDPFQAAGTNVGQIRTASGVTGTGDIYQIAGKIINVVLGFLGIVLLGYILYAGFLWMTSGGESEKAGEARTMVTNAIIGLVIIVSAFAISNFVLGQLVTIAQ